MDQEFGKHVFEYEKLGMDPNSLKRSLIKRLLYSIRVLLPIATG